MTKLHILLALAAHVVLVTSDSSESTSSESIPAESSSPTRSKIRGNVDNTAVESAGGSKGNAKCGYRPHERYVECPENLCGPQTCNEVGFYRECPEPRPGCCSQSPGCYCDEGYVRDINGKCIEKRLCPSCGGDVNAQAGCGVNCKRLCSNWNSTEDIFCIQSCDPNGCDCKKGYVKDENTGVCVEPNQCTPRCTKPNTEFSSCANGNCYTAKTCKDLDTSNGTLICPNIEKCIPGCVCKEGHVLDKKGNCIPEHKCPNSKCRRSEETYVSCRGSQCRPLYCSEVGNGNINCQIPENGQCPDGPGCVCRNGYAYDHNKRCIPIRDCPSCGPNNDQNATYGCGSLCGQRCSNYWKAGLIACPLICFPNSCDCKEGYVYDGNIQNCVAKEDCTKVCGQNEHYSSCANGGCWRARHCSDLKDGVDYDDLPLKCARPSMCIPDCICNDGYVKNHNNVCVNPKECKLNRKCRGANEFYDSCPPPCLSEKCSEIGRYLENCVIPSEGERKCHPACRCAEGYYRDNDGKCVWEQNCPKYCPPKCPTDAVWDDCVNGGCYGPRTCATRGGPTICVDLIPGGCRGGCRCRDGFLKNGTNGPCIPEYKCPPRTCPNKDEVWDDCVNGGCKGPLTCAQLADRGNETICIKLAPGSCQGGCICKKDWVRNDQGNCVPQNKCPAKTCGPNEEYNECPSTCPRRRCGSDDRVIHCVPQPKVGDRNCLPPACTCKPGYYRNNRGHCVKWEQCSKCSVNEVFDKCSPGCPPRECGINIAAVTCLAVNDTNCIAECRCKDGFLRNPHGTCVAEADCPPTPVQCNGINEEYDPCPDPCDSNTCESIGKKIHCPINIQGKNICKGKCKCKSGYYRNKIGDCISKADCLKCTKPHEFFSCGGACDNHCATLSQFNQTSCPIINVKCNEMCYCESGYARDRFKNCVPISECRSCPGPHEWKNKCAPTCGPETCADFGKQYNCPSSRLPPACKAACVCEDDYSRNANGTCIPTKDCPCGNDPNAIIGSRCGVSCDRYCSTYNSSEPVICTEECKLNECDCKPGYVYDESKNICTLPENCTPKCDNGGFWNTCPAEPCDADNCPKSRTDPPACRSTRNCGTPRCTCPFNHKVDRKTKKCVSIEKCPPFPCGKNEVYNSCPSTCIKENCTNYINNDTTCKVIGKIGITVPCQPKCLCKKGYYRNEKGTCVKASQCPKVTCPANEVLSECIEGVCSQQECSKKGEPMPCPDLGPGGCTSGPGCVCVSGYLRDQFGKCIPEDKCPPKQCGENARYSTCIQGECRPLVCADRGKNLPCPRIISEYCKKGCVCNEGYLESENGTCVEEAECPCSNGGFWNTCPAEPCDADNCPKSRTDPPACRSTRNCGTPRCTCGFNRKVNRDTGLCVATADCPPFPCDSGEEYNSCPSTCIKENCTNYLNHDTTCKVIGRIGIVVPCTPKCLCKKGHFRNSNGRCVLAKRCSKGEE